MEELQEDPSIYPVNLSNKKSKLTDTVVSFDATINSISTNEMGKTDTVQNRNF